MHQSVMTKIQTYSSDWILLDIIIKHLDFKVLRFLGVNIRIINSIKNGDNK